MNKIVPIFLKMTSAAWYAAIVLALAAGWAVRDYNYVVAESGIGYWLGIIGGSLMLMLLVYPMRKRFRRWAVIGSVKAWFRIHMILGLVGPLLIIYHSGFKLGSFNSSVALFCMLLVATSGLLGRYLYQRIHHGLYGRKLRFEELYSNENLPERLLRHVSVSLFVDAVMKLQKLSTRRHSANGPAIGRMWRLQGNCIFPVHQRRLKRFGVL